MFLSSWIYQLVTRPKSVQSEIARFGRTKECQDIAELKYFPSFIPPSEVPFNVRMEFYGDYSKAHFWRSGVMNSGSMIARSGTRIGAVTISNVPARIRPRHNPGQPNTGQPPATCRPKSCSFPARRIGWLKISKGPLRMFRVPAQTSWAPCRSGFHPFAQPIGAAASSQNRQNKPCRHPSNHVLMLSPFV